MKRNAAAAAPASTHHGDAPKSMAMIPAASGQSATAIASQLPWRSSKRRVGYWVAIETLQKSVGGWRAVFEERCPARDFGLKEPIGARWRGDIARRDFLTERAAG